MRPTLFALVAVTALAVPAVAHADIVDFSTTGHGLDLTFSLPSSPTPVGKAPHEYFYLGDVSFIENGVTMVADDAYFYTKADSGGFDLENADGTIIDGLDFIGPKLFTGTVGHPTFKTGDFKLQLNDCSISEAVSGNANSGGCGAKYTLSITPESTVTPEPGSFVLLGTGALGALGALRRRLAR